MLGSNLGAMNPTCCWVLGKNVSFNSNFAAARWDKEPPASGCVASSTTCEPVASGHVSSSAIWGPVASGCATPIIWHFFALCTSLAFAKVEESHFFIFKQLHWWFVYPWVEVKVCSLEHLSDHAGCQSIMWEGASGDRGCLGMNERVWWKALIMMIALSHSQPGYCANKSNFCMTHQM